MQNSSQSPNQRWLLVHTLAIAFSLSHVILDWWAELIALPGDTLSGAGMMTLVFSVGIYALWANALVMASHGRRWALWVTIAVSAISSLNGFAIVYCLPPRLFPVGDLSHIGRLVFCLWAVFESWRTLQRTRGTAHIGR
jgi:hypothetical protein